MRYIIKRDGRKVLFNQDKIYNALSSAAKSVGKENEEKIEEITFLVIEKLNEIYKKKIPTVENVQDVIEDILIEQNEPEIAKEYILYRGERTRIRNSKSRLMKTLYDITYKDSKDNDIKRENANIDGDTAMGVMLKYGSEAAKEFYLNQMINPRFAKAHQNGDIHIHDLDFYSLTMTCCQIDLIDLFKGGFSTGDGYIREPNSIRSYASLACIAIQANQNDQHGGQSIPNFDYAMALGVKKSYRKNFIKNLYKVLDVLYDNVEKDELKKIVAEVEEATCAVSMKKSLFDEKIKERLLQEYKDLDVERIYNKVIKDTYNDTYDDSLQAMEALIHNLNTMHSRAGAQVPFSSINYGTDTSLEGRMVVDTMLEATLRGLGNGETPIFPIQIFKVKEGINYNPGDPNYDLLKKAIKTSGKRLFPNFSFIDAPFNIKYYVPGDFNTEVGYMGCRTRVLANVCGPSVTPGRGNLSFTSINLPRLGIKYGIALGERDKADMKAFYKELDETMDLVKGQLLQRFECQCSKSRANFKFLLGSGVWLNSEKMDNTTKLRTVLKHGTLSIGFIGLAETLKALIGEHHGESEKAQKLGLEIIGHMRKKCDEYTEEYNLNFTCLATPAEGLSGRFVAIDRSIYGKIKGVTDRDYYTNSFHVPVYYKTSVKHKLEVEGKYHEFTNAGHISYIELDGDTVNNVDAFETVVRIMHDCGIGYGAINHPVDRDPVCGYVGVIKDVCPRCGRHEGEGVEMEKVTCFDCNGR